MSRKVVVVIGKVKPHRTTPWEVLRRQYDAACRKTARIYRAKTTVAKMVGMRREAGGGIYILVAFRNALVEHIIWWIS